MIRKKKTVFMDKLYEPELENIWHLVKGVCDLIQDQETFKLFTLALLFSGNEVSIPEIKLLKDTYLNVIRRRKNLDMDFMYQNESSNENLAFGHLVYSRFNSCISSIKELSIYIQKVMGIK